MPAGAQTGTFAEGRRPPPHHRFTPALREVKGITTHPWAKSHQGPRDGPGVSAAKWHCVTSLMGEQLGAREATRRTPRPSRLKPGASLRRALPHLENKDPSQGRPGQTRRRGSVGDPQAPLSKGFPGQKTRTPCLSTETSCQSLDSGEGAGMVRSCGERGSRPLWRPGGTRQAAQKLV